MSDAEQGDRRNFSEDYLAERAKFIRLETLRLTRIAGAGHYSSTFSAAELFAALYYGHLRLDPANPKWENRDRFVLSKGHAAIGLYPVLADLGFYPPSKLDDFTRLGSAFGDHPDMKKIPGIDFSSGSLGHGLSVALGMAIAGRMKNHTYRTYCMLGDGELNEGQIWEAAMAAGHFQLQGLVGIVDRNQLSIDGPTEKVMSVEPLVDRFTSFGWDVQRIDGHNLSAIMATLAALKPAGTGRPQMIIADTVKGRGVKYMELSLDWHVGNLVGDDYDDAWAEIEAGLQPFEKEDA
ncbi:transketolase [Tianweitania sp. BSSL-BM11]|uniref:Transketolase n=1 Tax=Tianweitania aestuarii TaxID=2814886 RepID=A0ABS5RRV4_9HYPH|nr:transketolase [Tianweitania aestuarii]MBS9719692.1 transketolase [Tianweitania aestuarii]